MSWTDVTVSRSGYKFPNRCPECLRYGPDKILSIASDTEKMKGYYVVAIKYQQLHIGIPFCTQCAEKRIRYVRYGKWLTVAGFVIGLVVAIWLDLNGWWPFILGIVFCSPGILLSYYYGRQVKVADYSDTTVTFSFKHPEYAQEFIQLNSTAQNARAT